MKKALLLSILFLSSFSVLAQDIAITATQSEIFKDKRKHTELLFSDNDDNGGFVTVRASVNGFSGRPKEYIIEYYGSDLKLVQEKVIDVDGNIINGMKVQGGKVYLMEVALVKDEEIYSFNILEAALNDFNFKKKTLFTLNEDEIKKYFGFVLGVIFVNNGLDQEDTDRFGEITFSKNGNFFCVNFDLKGKEEQKQRLYVFNKNFEKVFEKDFKRDIKDRLFDFENLDVDDNTGEVYLLGKVYENDSRRKKSKGKANYHFELYKISKDNQQSISFKTEENFIGSLFTLRSDDRISCAGFYSEKNDYRYKGVARFDIDPNTMQVIKKSFQPFSDQFMKDKYGKVKDKELHNLKFRSGFLSPQGDVIINAEEYFAVYHTSMGMNGMMNSYTSYHYNDIISVKINKEGELVWARNINKNQGTTRNNKGDYLSFSSTVVNNDTYIFINCSDNIKKLRNDRLLFKGASIKKSNLYVIKIDQEGNYSYKNIVGHKDSDVAFYVRQGISASPEGDEMVFIGRKNSKKQFLKLSIL